MPGRVIAAWGLARDVCPVSWPRPEVISSRKPVFSCWGAITGRGEQWTEGRSPWRRRRGIPAWRRSSGSRGDAPRTKPTREKPDQPGLWTLAWQSSDLQNFISNSEQNKCTNNEIHHLPQQGLKGTQRFWSQIWNLRGDLQTKQVDMS